MVMGIGFTEALLIAGVAILLFGGKKLPELGKGMGEAIKNFKQGMRESHEEEIKKDT
jgi:sec-independent protein translocase protein TatA